MTFVVGAANRYVETTAPWSLAKAERTADAESRRRLDVALGVLVETVRILGVELQPFVPEIARRLSYHAGSAAPQEKLPDPEPVFARLESVAEVAPAAAPRQTEQKGRPYDKVG